MTNSMNAAQTNHWITVELVETAMTADAILHLVSLLPRLTTLRIKLPDMADIYGHDSQKINYRLFRTRPNIEVKIIE